VINAYNRIEFASPMSTSESTNHQSEPAPEQGPSSRHVDIDLLLLEAAGCVLPYGNNTLIAEEYRVLKRPLLANIAGRSGKPVRNANLIVVTSALPGEGKSFTALNLAISMAMELERRVLLVDADVARPSLPRLLGITEQKGLLDVLQDPEIQLNDVLLRTNIDKLSVLTAGLPQPRATELLGSEAMAALLEEMAQRYPDRIIIFDSPPLMMTTEARVLVNLMGQVLFVVRAEETLQSVMQEALAMIAACPVKFMVLNQAPNPPASVSGYGYGYGYGSQPR
jgi:protein-tyrosine kinase